MKAKVIETGEVIDVKCLYPTIYSQLDCNHKIIAEYCADELEFESEQKMVPLDEVCSFLLNNLSCHIDIDERGNGTIDTSTWYSVNYDTISELIEGLKKELTNEDRK